MKNLAHHDVEDDRAKDGEQHQLWALGPHEAKGESAGSEKDAKHEGRAPVEERAFKDLALVGRVGVRGGRDAALHGLDLTREEDLTAGAEGGGHSGTTPGPAEAHAEDEHGADDQEELDREHRRQHGRDDEAEEAGAAEDEERFLLEHCAVAVAAGSAWGIPSGAT